MGGLLRPIQLLGKHLGARQNDRNFGEFARLCSTSIEPTVLLHDDIVTNGETEFRSLRRRLGRKEGVEHLVLNLRRNTGSVITDFDFHPITKAPR